VKKFLSSEDVEKMFHVLFPDISTLKKEKDKNGYSIFTLEKSLDFELLDKEIKDSKRSPGAPFTTSTLQQEASRKF
jgi:DNA topoisomerase-1